MLSPVAPRLAPLTPAAQRPAAPAPAAPRMASDTYLRVTATPAPIQAGGGGLAAFFTSLLDAIKALFGRRAPVAAASLPISYPAAAAPTPAGIAPELVGPVPLEGYDYGKLHDANHRTVKYVFGRVASHTSLAGVHDKAQADALLNSMLPALRAAGLEVVGAKGDKIQVKTEIGYEWVDVVRGAGSSNPGWWWGSEGKGTPSPTAG